jgi:hypothetical protein
MRWARAGLPLHGDHRYRVISFSPMARIVYSGILCIAIAASKLLAGETPSLGELNWKDIYSLQAKITVKGTAGFAAGEDPVFSIEWKEDREGRFYRKLQQTRFGISGKETVCSFDGATYYSYQGSSQPLIKTKKSIPNLIENFQLGFYPLEPFKFLSKADANRRNTYPGLREVAAYASKDGFLQGLSTMKPAQFQGKPARMFSLSGPGIKGPVTYNVYFSDEKNPALLGWDCLAPESNSTLIVTHWSPFPQGKIKGPRYPSDFTVQYYFPSSAGNEKTPSFRYEAKVNLVKVSDSSYAEDFAVDLTLADYLYDMDNRVTIPVPR